MGIQGPSDECEYPHQYRKADMSTAAAQALSTTLGRLEAAHRLASNCTRVVQDITNPGPKNIDGKTLTQTNLKRVDPKHKESVEEMVQVVCSRLLGQEVSAVDGGRSVSVGRGGHVPLWAHPRVHRGDARPRT